MKQSIQMCEGSLWKNIFFFGVPLMFAQILEVLFNLSDVAIVKIVYFLFCFQKIKKKIIDMK
ncbi:hypothetical protein CGK76_00960 [Erysipelotrichaceae bacterium 7770_A6]|nr:hypothetical protein [Erysipelotrichaceae bacterium 7770_A6]